MSVEEKLQCDSQTRVAHDVMCVCVSTWLCVHVCCHPLQVCESAEDESVSLLSETHTRTSGIHILWGHVIAIMLPLAPYPDANHEK